jgi:hypothetical protein
VERERAQRDEDHSVEGDDSRAEEGLERVEDAMREHDRHRAPED